MDSNIHNVAQINGPHCDTFAIFQKAMKYFHEKVKGNHPDTDSLTEVYEVEFNRLYNLKKVFKKVCLNNQQNTCRD